MERVKGIEPSQPAWKAGALPLSYTRMDVFVVINKIEVLSICRKDSIVTLIGAEDEIRTRDPRLGKAMLYHWATSA